MYPLAIKDYIIGILVVVTSILTVYLTMIKKDNLLLTTKLSMTEALILSNKTDYDRNLEALGKILPTITNKYETVYKVIDNTKGDGNATNCNDTRDLLNSANY